MVNKTFKVTVVLLVVVILASIMGACGSTQQTSETSTSTVAVSSAVTSTSAEEIQLKDLKLSLWIPYAQDNPFPEVGGESLVTDWLKEKTRITIDAMGNGGQEWSPKLTQMIAGDTLPNLLNSCGNHAVVSKLVEGDQIYEITQEMLQKYCPNITKRIPQWAWDMVKVNGKIYSVPFNLSLTSTTIDTIVPKPEQTEYVENSMAHFNDLFNIWAPLYIRDDILKKLLPTAKSLKELEQMVKDNGSIKVDDLVIPEIDSTDKFIKLMYDIKALNLKENNKTVYATGYPGSDNWYAMSSLGSQMYGYNNYFYTTFWDQISKSIKMGYREPVFKEAAKTQNKMLRDKVIDPESLVQNQQQFSEKIYNGRYAIYGMGDAAQTVNASLEKENKDYRYVPFITNIPNKPEYPLYTEPPAMPYEASVFKTVKEEDLPQVLKYIDACLSEEFEDVYYWGPKDAGLYTENADGSRTFNDTKFQETIIEGKATLKPEERKGIFYFTARYFMMNCYSKYYYSFLNKVKSKDIFGAKMFSLDSPHSKTSMTPEGMTWAANYSNLDLVKNFWTQRDVWDTPFKTALTTKSDEEFDKKWDSAIENMNKVCDMDKMLEQMTEIARERAKSLGIE